MVLKLPRLVVFDALNTVWKNEKFSLTKKILRQINSLVTYLVKPILSRNFCQKCVRENSRNFHTVLTVWQLQNFSTTQILREANFGEESRSYKTAIVAILGTLKFVKC